MAIISEYIIENIDCAKESIDEEKLEDFVDNLFSNLQGQAIINVPIQDADNADRGKEVVDSFQKAWKSGQKTYKGTFDRELLQKIALIIEPRLQPIIPNSDLAALRSGSARLEHIQGYLPPANEARIELQLSRLQAAVNDNDLHPVEEAVLLYMHIVRIQPFDNGNKRTANTIMNLTLSHHGFPVTYIAQEERTTYLSLLSHAFKAFNEQGSLGDHIDAFVNPNSTQRGFYDFLGNKIHTNLLMARDYLKNLKRYEVEIDSKNPGQAYAAKRVINGWFNKQRDNKTHQIKLMPKSGKLLITGEIPYDILNHIMEDVSKGRMKYSIERK